LPGRFQFFPILTFKGSLPGISKFYSSWKLRFPAPFQEFTKMLAAGKSANFSQRKKFPGISKNVSSWKTHFLECDPEKGKKIFSKKDLTKIKKYDILKLEKNKKGEM
jgi:hypothetical protein